VGDKRAGGGRFCLVETVPWKLFFDGSMCKRGQGHDVLWFHLMGFAMSYL
jgi:hypothetical protein